MNGPADTPSADAGAGTLTGRVVLGDAVVTLGLLTRDGRRLDRTAVIDTGSARPLTLPPLLFEKVRRGPAVRTSTVLADGSDVVHRAALVRVELCGHVRDVMAGDLTQEVLIGMPLLTGRRLTVDCVEGGPVTIEPLPR